MKKNLGLFILFLTIGLLTTLFFFRDTVWPKPKQTGQLSEKSSFAKEFSLEEAPSESLKGTIISFDGKIGWQSRIATQASELITPVPIQQGEKITTEDNGNMTIRFENGCLLKISPKTELDFIQTLATNFVFQEDQGTVDYINNSAAPLSVRSLGLLTQISSASAGISADKKSSTVTIDVNEGFVEVAYNDLNFVTQTQKVSAKKRIIFDDELRTVRIKQMP